MKNPFILLHAILALAFYSPILPQWIPQESVTTRPLSDVFFTNENDGWCVSFGDTTLILGNSNAILHTTNGGLNWSSQWTTENQWFRSVYFVDGNIGYTVGSGGTINKTINSGTDWISQTSGTTDQLNSVFFLNADTGFVVGGWAESHGTILKTTNGGQDWLAQSNDSTKWLFSICFFNPNIGLAVGFDFLNSTSIILKTINGGSQWSRQTINLQKSLSSVYFVDSNQVWAVGAADAVLKSTDGGSNWVEHPTGTTTHFNSVKFINQSIGWIIGWDYITGEGRIFKTTDAGLNWFPQSPGSSSRLNAAHFLTAETAWVVGDDGTILKTTNGGITFIEQSNNYAPLTYFLCQNFPNPFNPNTKIKFVIPKSEVVQIKVYNVLGKEIQTLLNDFKTTGTYDIELDANNLPSGVYFYRMISGNYSETKKMILLR